MRFGLGSLGVNRSSKRKIIPGQLIGKITGLATLAGALTVSRLLAGGVTGTGTLTGDLTVTGGGGGGFTPSLDRSDARNSGYQMMGWI